MYQKFDYKSQQSTLKNLLINFFLSSKDVLFMYQKFDYKSQQSTLILDGWLEEKIGQTT